MRIEDWSLCGGNSPWAYASPEIQQRRLQGRLFGHPRFEDGEQVTTSNLVHINGYTVFTHNGSQYFLGAPNVEYVEWCRETDCHVPSSEEPIKLS